MKRLTFLIFILIPIYGFSQSNYPIKSKFMKDWVYVPESSFESKGMIGNDSVNFDNRNRSIKAEAFYIYKTEITNKYYKQFLAESNNSSFMPDTNCWVTDFGVNYNQPMVTHYFRDETYSNYPVVGVSQIHALAFCKWLEQKINQDLKENKTYQGLRCEVTLPSSEQWESVFYRSYIWNQKDSQFGTWNLNKKIVSAKGKVLVNYGQETSSEGFVLKNYIDDGGFYTQSATYYKPNALGLYNFLGNVAEWTVSPAYNFNDYSEVFVDKNTRKVHYLNRSKKSTDTLESCHYWGRMEFFKSMSKSEGYVSAKGGSWVHGIFYMQPSVSLFIKPKEQHSYIGFRPVMVIKRVL